MLIRKPIKMQTLKGDVGKIQNDVFELMSVLQGISVFMGFEHHIGKHVRRETVWASNGNNTGLNLFSHVVESICELLDVSARGPEEVFSTMTVL